MATGDFNGDGIPEFAVIRESQSTFNIDEGATAMARKRCRDQVRI